MRDPEIETPPTAVPISMTVRDWQVIDATMDNLVALAAVNGSADDVGRGWAIRRAGWDQVPWVGVDRQWPPDDDSVTITLTGEQWRFVLDRFRNDEQVLIDIDDLESLRLGRHAVTAIEAGLERA